jgi:3-hydroxyacyl-[acyl-carrier-protein] dehydratase
MKQEELYTIKEFKTDGATICASVVFNKEHWIYQAHFPQRPVTPGAMVLQVAEDLISKAMGSNLKWLPQKIQGFLMLLRLMGRRFALISLTRDWRRTGLR